MRLALACLLLLLLIPCLAPAETTDVQPLRPSPVRSFLAEHLQFPSLQLSLFSYKPELGGLTDLLQSLGVSELQGASLPTASILFQHSAVLDSRLEIGYWNRDLDILLPTASNLSTTLIPISYQFIYRPVLLSEYLPIYFGGGIGFLGTRFSGSAVDLIEQQGISFDESSSGPTGFIFIGAELLQWKQSLSLNFEVKRILKTVETTGTTPLNLILDGTAVGFGVKFRI